MFKKLKTFSRVFKNSAYKTSYYEDVLKAPFSFSFKYFLFLFFVIGFTTWLSIAIIFTKKVSPYLNQLKTQIPQLYPADLTINIKDGQVSINVSEPYFIPLKPSWFPLEFQPGLENQPIHNVLVIDTAVEPSEINKYQTFILLTKDSVAFTQNRNEIRIQSLQDIKAFTLDRQLIEVGWQKIVPYFHWITPIILGLLFYIFILGTIIIQFIYLVIFSLLTFITAKFFKQKAISYPKALQINFHAVTLPTIISIIFQLFTNQSQIPFFQSIILFIFNLIIFTSINKQAKLTA